MLKSITRSRNYLRKACRSLSSAADDYVYAITCPGQGVIKDGLLVPYAKYRHHFQNSLDIIDESLNEKFSDNLFVETKGFGKEWLLKTSNAQPAILATTYIINEVLRKEYGVDLIGADKVKYVLGHSLGEYTAHLLSGVIDLTTAVRLVRERGILMENLITSDEYTMVAVMFKPTFFEEILQVCQEKGVLANINSYQQLVLSGTSTEVQEVIGEINAESKKIMRAIKLPVNIPFHNSILGDIEPQLFEFVGPCQSPKKPIVSNLIGEVSEKAFENTINANSQPVQWIKSVEYLIHNGVTDVINLGPGDVLQGLNCKFKIRNHSIDSLESMSQIRKLL